MQITTVTAPVPIAQPPTIGDDPLAGVGRDDLIDLDELDDDDDEIRNHPYYLELMALPDAELFADDPEVLAVLEEAKSSPPSPDPSPIPEPSEETSMTPKMTAKEKKQLAHNIENMGPDEFASDPLTRAVASYAPEELRKYLIPDSFPGMQDATWQMSNPTRMSMHSRAKIALGMAPLPRGGDERSSGNESPPAA